MTALITTKGREILASRLKGLLTEPVNIAWGTGVIPPALGDTGLEIEDVTGGYARFPGVSSIVTISTLNDTYQISGSLTALADLDITEWGLFDTAGNLLMREVQNPGYSLATGGTLNFLFKFQQSVCP